MTAIGVVIFVESLRKEMIHINDRNLKKTKKERHSKTERDGEREKEREIPLMIKP